MIKIISFVDRWLAGGIESYLVTSYENMDREDIDLLIVTTKKYTDLYDERLKKLGINIIELLPEGKFNEVTRTAKSLKAFKMLLRTGSYDLIHLNIYNGVSLAYAKLAKQLKINRVVAHSHNSAIGNVRFKKVKAFAHKFGVNRYMHYVDDFWACSDLATDWFRAEHSLTEAVIMNNGIHIGKFKFDQSKGEQFREQYNLPANQLILGSMGRLNNQKNQHYLIEIAQELKKKNVDFVLVVAGDGELKEELSKDIKEKQLDNHVLLIGKIFDSVSFYSGIDCFLLPSLFEGNPIVAIEAQASGLPCLLSDTITKQAKLSQNTAFLSINQLEDWTTAILAIQRVEDTEREAAFRQVKNKGFDILDTAEKLSIHYRK